MSSTIHPHPMRNSGGSEWTSVNVQPNWPSGITGNLLEDVFYLFHGRDVERGKSPRPVCPRYKLIEICGRFAGISSEDLSSDPHFCGVFRGYDYEGGCFGGHKWPDGSARPASACRTFVDQLDAQLHLVTNPPIVKPAPKIADEDDLQATEAAAKIMTEISAAKKALEERDRILLRWRSLIFDPSTFPTKKTESYLKRFANPEEMPEKEVIRRVRSFRDRLNRLAVGKTEELNFWWSGPVAKNCPVAPEKERGSPSLRRRRRFAMA